MRLVLRQKKRERKERRLMFAILIPAIVAVSLFLFIGKRSEILREVAVSELESRAYEIVIETVEDELSKENISYCDLVHIKYGSDGRVTSLQADTERLNALKLKISSRLAKIMDEETEQYIKIPLGNFTGIDFLSGVGPELKFRIMWVSSVNGNFSSTFDSVGINQTRHRIMLDFSVNAGMMFAGREVGADIGTSVCAAETVIVGDVPRFFSNKE